VSLLPLQEWVVARIPDDTRVWFQNALAVARQTGPASNRFAVAWSGCGRRLGRTPLRVPADEGAALTAAGAPFLPDGWGLDEAGRALLLLVALESAPAGSADMVLELFAHGEMREQQAVLRGLAYLPDPTQYIALAADAVRTNVLSVLEALACDNPFPGRHMPDLAFNQLIMKAIFNDLPLRRVVALAERNNAELRRMVGAYASERRAAGRPVPADVDFILGGTPHAPV
jgi:hypothetical protein